MCKSKVQLLLHVPRNDFLGRSQSNPSSLGLSLPALCPPGFAALVNLKVQGLNCLHGLFPFKYLQYILNISQQEGRTER